jgi:uncharacterized protein (DUF433 family)
MPSRATDPIALFEEKDVARLTGASVRALRYWHRSDFITPQNRRVNPSAAVALYDFRDLVGIKVVVELRNTLSLQCLRKIEEYLRKYADQPWGKLNLHLSGTELLFEDPATGVLTSAFPLGQTVHPQVVRLKEIAENTRQAVIEYRRRKTSDIGKIERSKKVQQNRPVIAGTRITTATIWSLHKEGLSNKQILKQFPDLSDQDITEAIAHEKRSKAA